MENGERERSDKAADGNLEVYQKANSEDDDWHEVSNFMMLYITL